MIIYQLQPRLFQAVQWLHWRKLNQTCGDRRKRRSCLVVTMIVKFNNSFLQSCISDLEGRLPAACWVMSSTQIQCSQIPDRYWDVFMHWDIDIGLNFWDLEAGIPDWDCETTIYTSGTSSIVFNLYMVETLWQIHVTMLPCDHFFHLQWVGYMLHSLVIVWLPKYWLKSVAFTMWISFDLSQLTFTSRTNGLWCDALLQLCRFVAVALVLGRLGVDNVTLDLRTCSPLPDEPTTCQWSAMVVVCRFKLCLQDVRWHDPNRIKSLRSVPCPVSGRPL